MSESDVASRIKEAAILVVAEEGVSSLNVSSVCARAGVTAASFHQHWPDAWAAMLDSLDDRARLPNLPDTGSLLGDLVAYALAYHARCSEPPFTACMFQLLAATKLDVSLQRKFAAGYFLRRARNRVLIERAVARGELSRKADGDAILDRVLRLVLSWIGVGARPPEPEVRTAIGRLIAEAQNANIRPR
jgi:AcrR family transcriptional regulator